MTALDVVALLPFLVLFGAPVVLMLAIAFYRNHLLALGLCLAGLAGGFAALFAVPSAPSRQVTALLVVDDYALFFVGLIIAAAIAVALLSHGYLERQAVEPEEFHLLLLLATLGSAVLAAATHFASFFLGLEILSVSLYGLIAYPYHRNDAVEAGLKYLVLAGVSSAFLLFGMALIYAETGTMEFGGIAASQAVAIGVHSPLWLAGMAMLVVGIGFKLAVVPFHMWTPDVYEGAPAPATAFVATVSKGAVFALLLRYFTQVDYQRFGSLFLLFVIIAVASMLVGNLLALLQENVKRLLAYSSISHLGYLLVAFLASGPLAATAVAFYLAAYFVTTLGAFGVVTVLSGRNGDAEALDEYRGLLWRHPYLAGVFTAMLLSLAGIPLTAGFIGKFYVAAAGVGAAQWLPVVVLVVASGIGVYYYLRVATAMYARPTMEIVPAGEAPPERIAPAPAPAPPLSMAAGLVLAVLTLALVWLGVYPGPVIEWIQATVGRVG